MPSMRPAHSPSAGRARRAILQSALWCAPFSSFARWPSSFFRVRLERRGPAPTRPLLSLLVDEGRWHEERHDAPTERIGVVLPGNGFAFQAEPESDFSPSAGEIESFSLQVVVVAVPAVTGSIVFE